MNLKPLSHLIAYLDLKRVCIKINNKQKLDTKKCLVFIKDLISYFAELNRHPRFFLIQEVVILRYVLQKQKCLSRVLHPLL